MSKIWESPSAKIGAISLISAGAALALFTGFNSKRNAGKNEKGNCKIIFKEAPKKWIKVGEVSELIIYPVKSCKGVRVTEGRVTFLGLEGNSDTLALRDRVFLLVTSDGVFRTQRNFSKMSLIVPVANGSNLTLSAPAVADVTFPVPQPKPESFRSSSVYKDVFKGCLDCGDEVAQWFSNYLDEPGLRLYFYTGTSHHRNFKDNQRNSPFFHLNDKGTFQDETSYMMMTQESLDKLNENLLNPVTIDNFRPSVVIKGIPHPFAEDLWTFIKIQAETDESSALGTALASASTSNDTGTIFKAAMPCMRCKLTTVVPEKGEFDPDGQPLSAIYKLKRDLGNEALNKLTVKAAVLGNHFGLFVDGRDDKELEERERTEAARNNNNIIRVGDSVYAALL